jgi:hypothetical protein
MINSLEESESPTDDFVVCDIENKPDGEVFSIDTAWRNKVSGEIEHREDINWQSWWIWLNKTSKDNERFRVIYAHNGGGWDWLSLSKYLLENRGRFGIKYLSGIIAGSKLITLSVGITKQPTIHLCDSLQLLRSPLDKLAKTFIGKGKVELPDGKLPYDIFLSDPDLFNKYKTEDTEILLQVMEKGLELIRKHVANIDTFGFTVGSTAMKVFKTIGLKYIKQISTPWKEDIRDILREGYKGGRVEVFKYGHFENVNVYDINSLYPSVMLDTAVPISDRGFWTDELHLENPSVYKIKFKQKNKKIPPILTIDGEGKYNGSGVFFSPELELLIRLDKKADIEIETGFVFIDSAIVFKDYVEKLYKLRLTDPDGPLSLLCKFLLNSLYGKFGQHSVREKIIAVTEFNDIYDIVQDGGKLTPINEDSNVFSLQTENACPHEHVGIAGMITAKARVKLYEGILNAGIEHIIYCDTDSIHTTSRLCDSIVSSNIGDFKLEFVGEGAYAGKKLYALRNEDKEKIRAKGVSVGGRNGCNLLFNDIVSLTKGEEKICEFKQPATPQMVFRGINPCVFQPRKRTIKKT